MAKGKGKGPKDIEIGNSIKRMLPCPITPAKADKKAREIVDVLTEIGVQKEKARPFVQKARELTLKVESLRHDIKSSTEDREVTCREERHYKTREVIIRRMDTKEVVESRTMTDEDRQEEIADLAEAGKRPGGKLIPMKGGKPADAKPEAKDDKKAEDAKEDAPEGEPSA